MPGAAQDFAFATPAVLTRGRGEGRALDAAKAERPSLVGAAVAERVERAADIEHANRPSSNFDDLPLPRRHLRDVTHDIASALFACLARHPASSLPRVARS